MKIFIRPRSFAKESKGGAGQHKEIRNKNWYKIKIKGIQKDSKVGGR